MILQSKLFELIDKSPEVPYFLVGILYMFSVEPSTLLRLMSLSLVFLSTAVVSGTFFKVVFKTNRPKEYRGIPIFRWGFPSMHSETSFGMAVFVYFFEPGLSPLFFALAAVYAYSRLKLGVHVFSDVLGGALLGVSVGFFCGNWLKNTYLTKELEAFFAVLLVLLPLCFTWARTKYFKKKTTKRLVE